MTEPEEIDPPTSPAEPHNAPETPAISSVSDFTEVGTETAAEADGDPLLSSSLVIAQLLAESEAVHSSLDTHRERLDRTEQQIQEVTEALLNQIAEVEQRGRQAVQALEAQSAQRLSALEAAEEVRRQAVKRVVETAEQVIQARKQDTYRQAWQSAPLTLRLKFARELLPDSHALQNVLKEAAALEDLRRRGHDLEAWLANYPALFADAAHALFSGGVAPIIDLKLSDTSPAEILATETLHEVRAALESNLQALGITWIAPLPGDPVLSEHEVTGEEMSEQGAGRVARLRRRGFRFQGRLALPAQVVRSAPQGAALTARDQMLEIPPAVPPAQKAEGAEQESSPPPTTPAAALSGESGWGQQADVPETQPAAQSDMPEEDTTHGPRADALGQGSARDVDELPDWLRMLRQRTFGCKLSAVSALAERVFALTDLPTRIATEPAEEARVLLTASLQPLLPLLGLRYEDGLPDIPAEWGVAFLEVQKPLSAWLAAKLGLSVVAPARGDDFDARTMEALETRRTVHAKENETVAKMERIGVVWRERPLILAQVVRYTTGGMA